MAKVRLGVLTRSGEGVLTGVRVEVNEVATLLQKVYEHNKENEELGKEAFEALIAARNFSAAQKFAFELNRLFGPAVTTPKSSTGESYPVVWYARTQAEPKPNVQTSISGGVSPVSYWRTTRILWRARSFTFP